MKRLLTYFFRGLVFLAPVAVTIYVCVWLFTYVDGWLGLPIPGAGFLATLALITLFGVLASNLLTRGAISVLDSLLNRLPFVRLVYSATRDLVRAFVGEERRFNNPVLVRLFEQGHAQLLGFVTHDSLEHLGEADHVAVYIPQSYNFAGQLWIFPASAVTPLDASSAQVMAFIVSGGVTDVPKLGSRTGNQPAGTATR